MIIDTHCHLYDDCFKDDLNDIVSQFSINNIKNAFIVGTDLESSKQAIEMAEKFDLYAIIGLYPEYADQFDSNFENFLTKNANNKRVVAIGEIGLDYHNKGYNKQQQIDVLEKQIKIAYNVGLPLCIHVRDAFGDILAVLEKNKQYLTNGGVIHCFSGSTEVAKQFIKLGFKLGFGGVCTFKNAKKTVECLQNIDAKDILIETDAPYLSPEPFRGKRNEPKHTNYVLAKIAEIKNIDIKKLEKAIEQNTIEIFKKYVG